MKIFNIFFTSLRSYYSNDCYSILLATNNPQLITQTNQPDLFLTNKKVSEFEQQIAQWEANFDFESDLEAEIEFNDAEADDLNDTKNLVRIRNDINQLFDNTFSDQKNIYHELFVPYKKTFDRHHGKISAAFKNKLIFKISKIIDKKVWNHYHKKAFYPEQRFEIWIKPVNEIKVFYKSNNYNCLIKINVVKNFQILDSWTKKFVWKHQMHETKIQQKVKKIRAAEKLVLRVNKKMFYDLPNSGMGWDLFYYLKGGLEEIALDFRIRPLDVTNMALNLTMIDFQTHVCFSEKKFLMLEYLRMLLILTIIILKKLIKRK